MHDAAEIFDLNRVAAVLESLEESIIFRLLDRAQFAVNMPAYQEGSGGFSSMADKSLFQVRLAMQENMDAIFGRFLVPEERPFSSGLPQAERTPPKAESLFPISNCDVINQNKALSSAYTTLVSKLALAGDDGHYGSSVEHDVYCLQAIARRIHYGALYVSECKFRAEPERYRALIKDKNYSGVIEALTRQEVEERILLRLQSKVDAVQSQVNTRLRRLVDTKIIVDFYRDVIINLTKQGELAYLIVRSQL